MLIVADTALTRKGSRTGPSNKMILDQETFISA